MMDLAQPNAKNDVEHVLVAAGESAPDAQKSWRKSALDRFSRQGLPHRRVESWRYTDARAMVREAFPFRAPAEADLAAAKTKIESFGFGQALRIVLLDGVFQSALSNLHNERDIKISPLSERLGDDGFVEKLIGQDFGADDAMLALNAALFQDGAHLAIAPNAAPNQPILLFNLVSGGAPHSVFSRSLIEIGAGATVKLVEICENSGAPAQWNDALTITLGANARLDHIGALSHGGEQSFALQSLLVRLDEHAIYTGTCLVCDSFRARRQIFSVLEGAGAKFSLRGLSLLRESEHADATIVVDHLAPHGESREFFRHILDDQSTGVYQGKVCVAQQAQKTDGAMRSQALILSEGAAMLNKPELEIFADDVVCGHGATVGQLDQDQTFYLQARGLSRQEAERLLLQAFAQEILDEIDDEALAAILSERAALWFSKRESSRP